MCWWGWRLECGSRRGSGEALLLLVLVPLLVGDPWVLWSAARRSYRAARRAPQAFEEDEEEE
jgi:hypothetical protein